MHSSGAKKVTMEITVRTRDASGMVLLEQSYDEVKLQAEYGLGGPWTRLFAWRGPELEPPEDADDYSPEIGGVIEVEAGPATDQADSDPRDFDLEGKYGR